MESRARLMRGFSHDVKNPLGAAEGHAYILEEEILGALSPKQRETMARIRQAIRSALNLIDDLLEIARAESGQISVHPEPTDVEKAARETVAEYRAQAEAARLMLVVGCDDAVPTVETDVHRLRQILGNLVSNAVKYTECGRIDVRISVRETADAPGPGPWICIDVADTGIGIPEEQQNLLFQEFTRLDPTARGGAGLGLAISRHIARALGGEITLESEVGEGSTFTLWLPAAPPAANQRETG